MKKKAIAILVAATMALTSMVSLTGCKKDEQSTDPGKQVAKFTGTKVYKTTNGKVKTLNPHTWQNGNESEMMAYLLSPFTEYFLNDKNQVEEIPTMAKELMKCSDDKKVWTVKLREGQKFSDGTPIDAETYMTSFKYALDPTMKNYRANLYFNSITIDKAHDYFDGKCKWEEVGIKALDKETLQFTFAILGPERDLKNTLNSISQTLVNPKVYEKYMSADKKTTKYGTSLESMKDGCYGPYVLTDWQFDQSYKLEKVKDHPSAKYYTTDVLETRVVEDPSTVLQLFENKEIDDTGVPAAAYDKYKEDPRLLFAPTRDVMQMNVNGESKTNPVLADGNFRKALFFGMDRSKVAKDIIKSAYPAPYMVSHYFSVNVDGKNMLYRDTEGAKSVEPKNNGFDAKLSKEYFDKAYAANGNKKITVLVAYSDSNDTLKSVVEFLKAQYENNFGADKFEFKLQAVPAQVSLQNIETGKYEIGFMRWGSGTRSNPVVRFGPFVSNYGDKCDSFKNKEFDALYEKCTKGDWIFDEKAKYESIQKLEKMMIDDASVIPMWETKTPQMFSDKIKLRVKEYTPDVGFAAMQSDFTR